MHYVGIFNQDKLFFRKILEELIFFSDFTPFDTVSLHFMRDTEDDLNFILTFCSSGPLHFIQDIIHRITFFDY